MVTDWRGILNGKRRDLVGRLSRCILHPLSWIYRIGVRYRNDAFATNRRPVVHVDARVISIGNITTGGTGKTPLVIWLVKYLESTAHRVAIVSRGYGAKPGAMNDEAKEMAICLPGIPQVQNANRIAAAQQIIASHGSQVIVLDDGFQHRGIYRDLDIALIDATCPWGFGYLLPRGLLREPREQLSRAAVIVLTRSNAVQESVREEIRLIANRCAPDAVWVETSHAPLRLIGIQGDTQSLELVSCKRVFGFCAIGNPQAFRQLISELGADVVGWKEFPDHHHFTMKELTELQCEARELSASYLLCTQKDLVKLPQNSMDSIAVLAVAIELRILVGEAKLLEAIDAAAGSGSR